MATVLKRDASWALRNGTDLAFFPINIIIAMIVLGTRANGSVCRQLPRRRGV